MITVSYDDLEMAMETSDPGSFGMCSYLDRETGEVLTVSDDHDEPEVSERIDAEPRRYVEIPAFDPGESYGDLVRFAESIDEEDIRDQLEVALAGRRGVFGRFHHVLAKYPDLRGQWQVVERDNRARRMREWLADEGIEAELHMPPQMRAVEQPPSEAKERVRPGLIDVLLVGAPDGKTELIQGRVWRQLRAPSANDARAAFKRLAREACEMSGVAWRKRFVQGTSKIDVGRFHMEHDGSAVYVSVDVHPAVWRMLCG